MTSYTFLSKNLNVFQELPKSKLLSFMTKMNLKNGNETISDIFHGTYSKLASFFIGPKILKYLIIIGIFQFHCKSEHKQVKWHQIKWDMCKSDSVFPYLQSSTLFK